MVGSGNVRHLFALDVQVTPHVRKSERIGQRGEVVL
jgi:hypothetical protein